MPQRAEKFSGVDSGTVPPGDPVLLRRLRLVPPADDRELVGGKTGGIPKSVFRPGVYTDPRPIEGGSGEKITAHITADTVRLTSIRNPEIEFLAMNMGGALWLDVRTSEGDGKKHPDFYAKELIGESVNYFDQFGTPVTSIVGRWLPPHGDKESTNYSQYVASLQGKEHVTDSDREVAARSVWSSKAMGELGFTGVSVNEERDAQGELLFVVISYKKPEPAQNEVSGAFHVTADTRAQAATPPSGRRASVTLIGYNAEEHTTTGRGQEQESSREGGRE